MVSYLKSLINVIVKFFDLDYNRDYLEKYNLVAFPFIMLFFASAFDILYSNILTKLAVIIQFLVFLHASLIVASSYLKKSRE